MKEHNKNTLCESKHEDEVQICPDEKSDTDQNSDLRDQCFIQGIVFFDSPVCRSSATDRPGDITVRSEPSLEMFGHDICEKTRAHAAIITFDTQSDAEAHGK